MNDSRNISRATRAAVLAAVLSGACASPAFAQSMQQSTIAPADRAFVTSMLQESRGQSALARLAATRTTDAETSTAAAQTISEWSSLRSRLSSIAYAQGAPVRGALDAHQRALLRQLGRTQPARFDRAFLKDIQSGNAVALDRMQRESATMDRRLQRFITYAQPIVSRNEQMTSDDIAEEYSRPG